jgi:hypothetical protein
MSITINLTVLDDWRVAGSSKHKNAVVVFGVLLRSGGTSFHAQACNSDPRFSAETPRMRCCRRPVPRQENASSDVDRAYARCFSFDHQR